MTDAADPARDAAPHEDAAPGESAAPGRTAAEAAPRLPGERPLRSVARSPLSDGEWHRLHPFTPLLRGGLFLVVVTGIVVSNLRERIVELFLPDGLDREIPDDPVDFVFAHDLLLWAALAVLALVAVLLLLFSLAWRFHTFRITGDDVEVRRGVLFRSHRRAPLDRVQGVNLTRPLVARLLGMAKLEVVGAGSDANVTLDYLATANAEAVRADILRLASGRRLAEAEARGRVPHTRVAAATAVVSDAVTDLILGAEEPAEPDTVVSIPVARLIASRILDGSAVVLMVVLAAIVWVSVAGTLWLLLTLIPAFLGFGSYWTREIVRSLRYAIAPTPDGVRITFGLFTTVTEILPPGRVHAIEITQPLLWRPFGWWSITVNRLHGGGSRGGGDLFATVLPVGRRGDVERVLRLLVPQLDAMGWTDVFTHGLLGPRPDDPYTNTPGRARVLRLLSWRRNGFLLADGALLVRRGVIRRALVIVPLARMQSIAIDQGPLDRALGVAAVHAHTIAGRVSGRLGAVDRDAALTLFARGEAAAITAAAADRTHRWANGRTESAR